MSVHDELGMRMKEYENVSANKLTRRTPVAIRIDGKAFHTFTRGFDKPFDRVLMKAMQDTMKYLCERVQGCVLGYTQSDEITLILVDYKQLNSSAWFDYKVQKLCSVTASMATLGFSKAFKNALYEEECLWDTGLTPQDVEIQRFHQEYMRTLKAAEDKGAMFDARCFNIPKEEVTNLIYWRQLDAIRHSIQMIGQANFSHKELQGKSCEKIKEMLLAEKGMNWDYFSPVYKYDSCCIKVAETDPDGVIRANWEIDENVPLFIGDGREYIESLIQIGE